jgi:polysaccharide biosynthesis protein PelF
MKKSPPADVCLILEGTYPYVAGGVSTWTHDLILAQKDITFSLVSLVPIGVLNKPKYEIPANVISQTVIPIQQLPQGKSSERVAGKLCEKLEGKLLALQDCGGIESLIEIIRLLRPLKKDAGASLLLNSKAAWDLLVRMYLSQHSQSSFMDYFWSWRGLLSGLYSVLLGDLPEAKVYHSVSTGYAGLYAARAAIETSMPVLLTEHGIYTNERRIEIGMADWLRERRRASFNTSPQGATLKDMWINMFIGYSRACYAAAQKIITLYEGNQPFQLRDGAAPEKLMVIPNGVDCERFSKIQREHHPHRRTVAFIGRVVPIKDVKTFIRACSILRETITDVQAFILGPTEEDPEYFRECKTMVAHLGLQDIVTFTGPVRIDEYFPRVDVMVLTSISEAQPLTILEAGATGIPSVATDVGACREMILGRPSEDPALGPGGAVTPLCNPAATAGAIARLLEDDRWYSRCSRAIQARVRLSYNKDDLNRLYAGLYESSRSESKEMIAGVC